MTSNDRQHDSDLGTTVSLIRGMVLAQAASQASGEAVRTEVVGDSTLVEHHSAGGTNTANSRRHET